ncbi:MAG: type II toxin-antitoxin system RelE/ParE family toxin [Alphaproteobacteria bacterium]|nr:type II toxin-antitoxin system RelE/ParE family toxin [Alphaproteobacteria bacterium]
MSLERVILPEAEDELDRAYAWYEERRVGLGLEFLGAVEAAMSEAAEFPMRWPIWMMDDRYRRIVLRRFPSLIFYEIRGETIEFVAVAHARRAPGYWLDRGPTR